VERNSENQIAVVYAEGNVLMVKVALGMWDGVARILRKLRQDGDVKAIVLRVNSPGGSATPLNSAEVRLTGQVKPVVVSMGNVAASGGYWL